MQWRPPGSTAGRGCTSDLRGPDETPVVSREVRRLGDRHGHDEHRNGPGPIRPGRSAPVRSSGPSCENTAHTRQRRPATGADGTDATDHSDRAIDTDHADHTNNADHTNQADRTDHAFDSSQKKDQGAQLVSTNGTSTTFEATPIPFTEEELALVTYNSDGLVGAIVQDASDGAVLMFAYMNSESL